MTRTNARWVAFPQTTWPRLQAVGQRQVVCVVGVALDRLHQRRQGVDRLHRIVLTTQHAVAETAGGIRRIDVAEVVQTYQALLFGISVLVGGCIQAVLDQDLAIGGA